MRYTLVAFCGIFAALSTPVRADREAPAVDAGVTPSASATGTASAAGELNNRQLLGSTFGSPTLSLSGPLASPNGNTGIGPASFGPAVELDINGNPVPTYGNRGAILGGAPRQIATPSGTAAPTAMQLQSQTAPAAPTGTQGTPAAH